MCVAITKHGYFIYDDLLDLNPGGWQGGFVPSSSPFHNPNLLSLRAQVPIFIMELVDENDGGFEKEREVKQKRDRANLHGMKLREL